MKSTLRTCALLACVTVVTAIGCGRADNDYQRGQPSGATNRTGTGIITPPASGTNMPGTGTITPPGTSSPSTPDTGTSP